MKDFKEKHIWDKPNEPIQNTIQLLYNPNMSVPQENDPEYMLSGGERAKVELMRLLNEPVDLLMLDEPGVALEKEACSQLIRAVNAFPGTVILTSHDEEIIESYCAHRSICV